MKLLFDTVNRVLLNGSQYLVVFLLCGYVEIHLIQGVDQGSLVNFRSVQASSLTDDSSFRVFVCTILYHIDILILVAGKGRVRMHLGFNHLDSPASGPCYHRGLLFVQCL